MRLALVTTSYPAYAGDACGHFVESEARRLARGADVTVVTAEHTHELEARGAGREAWTVVRLAGHDAFGWPGIASRLRSRPERALGVLQWMRSARRVLVRARNLDRIVAHWAIPCGWPVASRIDVPVELVSHGADVRMLVSSPAPVRARLVERLLRDAETWRFVSPRLLEDLLRGLDPEQARRVRDIARVEPSPIDMPDVRNEARAKRGRDPRRLVVCVGRLVRSKRVDRVIEHVAASRAAMPDTRLVVVGDGPLRHVLERLAAALGVDADFVGLTSRPDALAWIAAADVVLHASEAEGLSTVEREARALGVPFRSVLR